MLHRARLTVASLAIALFAIAAAPSEHGGKRTTAPSAPTSPTSRPVSALLVGTYRGTVVDDDEKVPCVTTFSAYRGGKIVGTYFVREGDEQYEGVLSAFTLVSDARRECRFRWRDKHGQGIVTLRVSADGRSFEGSWGLEVVQDQLVWTGSRAAATTRRTENGRSENGGR